MSRQGAKTQGHDLEEVQGQERRSCCQRVKDMLSFVPKGATPPNWPFLWLVFISLFSSAFTLTFLFPFLPAMILTMGYKEEDKGTYAGLIASSVFAGRAVGSFFWGWLSDFKGRRLVLLVTIGLNGLFSFLFGFVHDIYWAMLLRFLAGLANGTVGVAKTVLYDVSDNTNQAFHMSVISIAWGSGLILGPTLGGYLALPASKYPTVFSEDGFFGQFPFVLPSFCCLLVCLICFIIVFLKFQEPKMVRNTAKELKIAAAGDDVRSDDDALDAWSSRPSAKPSPNGTVADNLSPQLQPLLTDSSHSLVLCQSAPNKPKIGMSLETLHCESDISYYYAEIESEKREENLTNTKEKLRLNVAVNGEQGGWYSLHNLNSHSDIGGATAARKRRYSHGDHALREKVVKLQHGKKAGKNGGPSKTPNCGVKNLEDVGEETQRTRTASSEKVVNVELNIGEKDSLLTTDHGGASVCGVNSNGDGVPKNGDCKEKKNGDCGKKNGDSGLGDCPVVTVEVGEVNDTELVDDAGNSQKSCCRSCWSSIRNSALLKLLSINDVQHSVGLYTVLSFAVIGYEDIFTVFASTSPDYDGLGFSTDEIGTALGVVSLPLMFIQIKLYPYIVAKFGIKKAYLINVFFIFVPVQILPMLHLLVNQKVWLWALLIGLSVPMRIAANSCFAGSSLLVNNSVTPDMAGKANGIGMTATAIARTLAPTLGGALFSWSLKMRPIHGPPLDVSLAFVFFGVVLFLSAIQCLLMPDHLNHQKK